MKNLIIHPEDITTTFLKPVYKQAENKSIIDKDSTPDQISKLIKTSDRILAMGHGSPYGLFSMGLFQKTFSTFKCTAIGETESKLLRDKTENVYIWCHADKFVEHYDLKGFYSGMFISEVGEANYCGVTEATQDQVDESNNTFAEIVGKYINLSVADLYEKVMEEYGELAKTNPVAKYNHNRLYFR